MSGLRICPALLSMACTVVACGGASNDVSDPSDVSESSLAGVQDDIPTTPRKEGPPPLSAKESSELAGKCNPIEPDLYEAGKAGMAALEAELSKGTASEAAEKAGLDAALDHMRDKNAGLSKDEHQRCLTLFGKQMRKRLFDFEPHEQVARGSVDSCVKRAVSAFGKESTVIEYGGSSGDTSQGPFCPDDFPVPPSLNDLPYKSTSEDWDTPAWKCLSFGLRIEQHFQIEYAAPRTSGEFVCIARFLPRQGGAPIELLRGGKVNDDGELRVADKMQRRHMK